VDNSKLINFIRNRYPKLQYLITVCTGAALAAQAGVLDGHNATTNKMRFNSTVEFGPKTYWVAQARWVQSGNIWSSSGVSAGTDAVIAWIEALYGNDTVTAVINEMEYNRVTDPHDDPFAALYGDVDVPPKK
jgi:transcriptional regulator GlxA family with amidase domain